MKWMRIGLLCALVGCMSAVAQAQWGTYGSPDPIPLGQYAPQNAYQPAVINRTAYVNTVDPAGPTLSAAPASGNLPLPPSPGGGAPQNAAGNNYIPQPSPAPGYAPPMSTPPGYPQPSTPPAYLPQPAGPGCGYQPTESAAVSGMLNEPTPAVGPAPGCDMMPAGGYMKNAANCDNVGDVCGCNACCDHWYASADALYMTRSAPRTTYTSAEPTNNPVHQGYFNDVNWTWGVQGTLGYRFGCNCEWSAEITYWDLVESNSDGGPGIPGPYVTPMTFGLTNMLNTSGGGGNGGLQTADQWFNSAQANHIWRSYDVENVEGNIVRNLCGGGRRPYSVDFLFGVRWFRFQDDFMFGSQRGNDLTQYANQWAYLNDHITNDLIGGQLGFNASYRFFDCLKVFVRPCVGIYDNHMTLDYNLYAVGNNGQTYEGSPQSSGYPNYPVHATTDGFAFLTQVDLGLDWQVCRHVSAQLGYRVVAATGMGLSDSQVPFFANDTPAISNIQHSDSLLVHGAFGGVAFTW